MVLLLTATTAAGRVRAQAPDCTYDDCALRLQARLFSERVVKGRVATEVARLGLFASHIEPLATARDSARTHYEAFRRDQNRGGVLTLIGAVSSTAAFLILVPKARGFEDAPASAWVLLGVGFGFAIAANANVRRGRDHLHRSIWFYNRSLALRPD